MPLLRSAFIALSTNQPLRRFSENSSAGRKLSSRFVAGLEVTSEFDGRMDRTRRDNGRHQLIGGTPRSAISIYSERSAAMGSTFVARRAGM